MDTLNLRDPLIVHLKTCIAAAVWEFGFLKTV